MLRTTKGRTSAVLFLMLVALPLQAMSAPLEKGKAYRLMRSVYTLQSDEEVPKGSTADEQRLLWNIEALKVDLVEAESARDAAITEAAAKLAEAQASCSAAKPPAAPDCVATNRDVIASKAWAAKTQKNASDAQQKLTAAAKAQDDMVERRKNVLLAESQTKDAEAQLSKATDALAKAQGAELPQAQTTVSQAAQSVAEGKRKLSEAKAAYDALSVFAPVYAAASGSRFIVEAVLPDGSYAIRMESVYTWDGIALPQRTQWVTQHDSYLLPKQIGSAVTEDLVAETKTGIVSGPLVVPFKWHFDGNDLGGSATVGAYVGYAFAAPKNYCGRTVCPNFIPLISAGLSQVSVGDGTDNKDTKSAISVSGGIMITSWDSLNIGLVVGVDWTGDNAYAHEGEAWTSFMIGWDLAAKKTN